MLQQFEKMPKAQKIMDNRAFDTKYPLEARYIYKFVIKYPGL